jgi:hypothetical protein
MQPLWEMPGDISITAVDVAAHHDVAALAEGRGELTGLALWLMAERQKVLSLNTRGRVPSTVQERRGQVRNRRGVPAPPQGDASTWAPFLRSLPQRTLTPVLWPEGQRARLLRGSPALKEATQRAQALAQEWDSIAQRAASDPGRYPAGLKPQRPDTASMQAEGFP